jgi:hypothetical protein
LFRLRIRIVNAAWYLWISWVKYFSHTGMWGRRIDFCSDAYLVRLDVSVEPENAKLEIHSFMPLPVCLF